jgi:hypothetical protein
VHDFSRKWLYFLQHMRRGESEAGQGPERGARRAANQAVIVLGGYTQDLAVANAVTPASAAAPVATDHRPESVNLLV